MLIENLVPIMPLDIFLTPQKPGKLITSRRYIDFTSDSVVDIYIKNNRCFTIQARKTDQLKNSFFYRTTVDWNQVDNRTVHAGSIATLRSLICKRLAAHHQQASETVYLHARHLDSSTYQIQMVATKWKVCIYK